MVGGRKTARSGLIPERPAASREWTSAAMAAQTIGSCLWDVGRPETRLLVISELGYGKLTLLDKYRPQNRGGKGLMTFKITKKTGVVAAAQLVEDDNEVYVVSEQAQVIRTNLEEIRSIGRVTQGVSIFKPAPGDKVTSIACVSDLRAAKQAETRSTNGSSNGRNGSSQMTPDGSK